MATFVLIVQLLPAIIELVKAVESAIPEDGKGNEKLAAVQGIIADTVEGAEKVLPAVTKVVTRLVGLFNATGQFKKVPTP